MPGWAVADYPVPPRYQYHLPRLARAVWNAPLAAVVAGSSHTGLPLALARRPYVLWVATLYSEELQSRADVGDVWAAGLIHSSDWPMLEAQEQLVYERAGVILGLSLHTTEMIAARWPGVRPKLRTVVYPVDIERFQPGAAPADPPYILLTARIRDPRKNVNLLLRSFARVRTSFQRVRLIIAGDEPSLDTEHLAAELGLGEAVRFVGHVSPDELSRLYQQATLFVFPSRQEGLGISVLEAMACGLPVVCTRCGGPEGLILDNVTGRLTPNGDEAALANAIIDLLRQPQRAQAMGAAGRARAVNEFARSHVETQLRAAFKDVFGDAF
jgi:glycosyltransferase involved in cell wall biosynthesis